MENEIKLSSIEQAIKYTVQFSGKTYKQVSIHIWPTLKVERAHQRFLECLNSSKNQKFSMDEIINICNYCGLFYPLTYFANECFHTVHKINPNRSRTRNDGEMIDIIKEAQTMMIRAHNILSGITENNEETIKVTKESNVQSIEQYISSKK